MYMYMYIYMYVLHIPLQYLLDIGSCVSLSRSLVNYCSQKLGTFYELNQRLQKSHPPPALKVPSVSISTPGIEIKVEPQLQTLMETNEEEDSVFNDPPTIKPDPDQKPPVSLEKEKDHTSSIRTRKDTAAAAAALRNEEAPAISRDNGDEWPAQFGWCIHHHSLMLHLSSIIQTISIQCPTAFVHTRVKNTGKDAGKRSGGRVREPWSQNKDYSDLCVFIVDDL